MKQPKIVATVGSSYDYKNNDFFDILIENGIKNFRFNLSKYDNSSLLEERVDLINFIYERNKSDIKIIVDLPFPGRKPRITLKNVEEKIHKDDILMVTSNINQLQEGQYKSIYLDVENFCEKIHNNKLIYSDGECSFDIVKKINDNAILVRANDSQTIYDKKSLSFGYIENSILIDEKYLSIISLIKAESIAFSFVSKASEVLSLKKYFPGKKIISKIETEEVIANINEIAEISDIMLGRGDLCLNSNYYNLYNFQNRISAACKEKKSKLYFATGILTSLITQTRVSQSDIIDVSNMLVLEPDYIMLNYPLLLNNWKGALQTISGIYNCLNDL